MEKKYLITGLGNPGKAYERTRHNVGFEVLKLLAKKHQLAFQKKLKYKGSVAEGKVGKASVILLLPETYMNLSGESVALMMRYKELELSHFLVVVDDVAIPLGQLRIRPEGSSGGHNGLKSLEEALHTQRYLRLRVGVGAPKEETLSDYVLEPFSKEEEKLLPEVLERAVQAIEIWLENGIVRAMDVANARSSNPSNGEKKHE